MTPRDPGNVHTNTCFYTNFYVHHGTKSTPVLLPADGEVFWLLLPSLVSLLSDSTVQPENTYYCILKVTGQVWESQKTIRIRVWIIFLKCHHENQSLCQLYAGWIKMKTYDPTIFPRTQDNIFLTVTKNKFVSNYPFSGETSIYLIEFSNINDRIKCKIWLKLTKEVPDIILVSLLLTLNTFDTLF